MISARRSFMVAMALGTAAILMKPEPAKAECSPNAYLGSICMTGMVRFCPGGYADANGGLMSINGNEALFSLFSDIYGGNGRTDFALPDLRAFSPIGAGTGPGLEPVVQGTLRGSERHALSIMELPVHSHQADFTPTTTKVDVFIPGQPGKLSVNTQISATTSSGADATPSATNNTVSSATGAARLYGPGGGTNVALANLDTTVAGTPTIPPTITIIETVTGGIVSLGDTPERQTKYVPNIPPQMDIRYCVAIEGPYPPRPN